MSVVGLGQVSRGVKRFVVEVQGQEKQDDQQCWKNYKKPDIYFLMFTVDIGQRYCRRSLR